MTTQQTTWQEYTGRSEMRVLTLDVETSIHNKGNPFDSRNRLVMVGLKPYGSSPLIYDRPINVEDIEDKLDTCDLLVGFNIKFDIHWLLNVGVDVRCIRMVHDCQIAEFMLNSQNNPYPSLNEALEKYGLPLKLDVVKTEYWDKGIDTTEIPHEVLTEYLEYDLTGTESVFKRQYEQFTGKQI